jgi:hypothetical protein
VLPMQRIEGSNPFSRCKYRIHKEKPRLTSGFLLMYTELWLTIFSSWQVVGQDRGMV